MKRYVIVYMFVYKEKIFAYVGMLRRSRLTNLTRKLLNYQALLSVTPPASPPLHKWINLRRVEDHTLIVYLSSYHKFPFVKAPPAIFSCNINLWLRNTRAIMFRCSAASISTLPQPRNLEAKCRFFSLCAEAISRALYVYTRIPAICPLHENICLVRQFSLRKLYA